MHIYFVNQYSKIVGPFDITDSNHQKNIRYGDVIIRDTSDGLCFLIVTSSINKWNRCKCIDTVQGHLKREGNFPCYKDIECAVTRAAEVYEVVNKKLGKLKI